MIQRDGRTVVGFGDHVVCPTGHLDCYMVRTPNPLPGLAVGAVLGGVAGSVAGFGVSRLADFKSKWPGTVIGGLLGAGAGMAAGAGIVASDGTHTRPLDTPATLPPAAPAEPTQQPAVASSYDASTAIDLLLGSNITVASGQSIRLTRAGSDSLWANTHTSDATVVAPSVPATTNGFVAVAPGQVTLTGVFYMTAPVTPGSPFPVSTTHQGTSVVTVK